MRTPCLSLSLRLTLRLLAKLAKWRCRMAYSSNSSSESEDLDDVATKVIARGDITGAAWYDERTSEETDPPENHPKDPVKITARAYQTEMFEASLKENMYVHLPVVNSNPLTMELVSICAMDTGSGKTQV